LREDDVITTIWLAVSQALYFLMQRNAQGKAGHPKPLRLFFAFIL